MTITVDALMPASGDAYAEGAARGLERAGIAIVPSIFGRADADSIAALPVALLYARVDLIRLAHATLALMEIEAIEPDLYPNLEPALPDRLAKAVLAAM